MNKRDFIKWLEKQGINESFSIDVSVREVEKKDFNVYEDIIYQFQIFVTSETNTTTDEDYEAFQKSGWVEYFFDIEKEETQYIPCWQGKENPADDLPWAYDPWADCDEEAFKTWQYFIEKNKEQEI